MRKSLLFAVFTIILSMAGLAQNGKISYQAVVRNSANQLVHDQDLDVTVGIANSETGTAVYTETHAVHSNANGLISLLIGNGTPVAGSNWDAIQWNHAWVTAVVSQGGTELATHHLPLSAVPYALYADQVDPVALANYLTANHYLTEEVQVLSISNDTIYLTGGSWVKLPVGFSGDYNDLTNKPTNVSTFNNDAGYLTKDSAVITNLQGDVTNLQGDVTTLNTNVAQLQEATRKDALCDSVEACVKGWISDSTRMVYDSLHTYYATTDALKDSLTRYVSKEKLNDTLGHYLQADDLCDSIVKCDVIRNLRDSVQNNTENITNNTTNITNITNNITNYVTNLQGADSVLAERLAADSTNLADNYYNKTDIDDTLSHYLQAGDLCDSIVKCDVIQNMRDSIRTNASDIKSLQNADAALSARITADSTNLAGNYYNKTSIKDTLSHYLMHEEQMLSIGHDTIYLSGGSFVKLPAGFGGSYHDLVDTPTNVSAFTNDAGYLTSFTEQQMLSISNDTIYLTGGSFVKLPAGFSGNYNDLTNKPDLGQYATNEHLNDTLNNYYTQEQIRDTLNNYYTQTQIKDTLSHYLQAGDLCDSIVKCDIVRTLRDSIQIMFDSIGSMHDSIFVNTTNITNNTENITTITNNVNNITTDIHALDSVISARIIRDSTELSNRMDTLLTYVCDSVETCVKGWISDSTRMIVDSLGAYYDTTLMKKAIHDTADVLRGMMTDAANDAKITIRKNSGDVGHFTLNQATDQAINILVPTTVAEMTDASNYVTHTQLNDTLGAYYDTTAVRTVIHDSLGNYLTINGLCDSVKKCDVIKDMQTDITKLQTADNNLSTRIQNDSTNLKDHYYTKTQVDSATNKVRNDICDSATHCMERALANPNSSINNAVDTIAANIAGHAIHDTLVHNVQLTNQGDSLFLRRGGIVDTVKFPAAEMIHDSLGKYVLKTAVRDSITNNVNLTVKNDSLFLTHGNGIDTVPAGKMIKDSIESRVHDGKLAVITHGATKLDTIQKFTANQAGNDTLDLSRYALMDTLHDYYATKAALAESVQKIDSLAGVTSRDSVRLKNHYYTKDEIDTKLHDTTKYALRTALRDTALNIRNDICDSATHCMERALANPNSSINNAVDTIAANIAGHAIHDTLVHNVQFTNKGDSLFLKRGGIVDTVKFPAAKMIQDSLEKYVLKTAVRDSITNNVNLTVKHDSLFLTHGKDIDTVPAGKMIKDSIASRVHDGKLAVITHGATKLDTIQKFTANQAGNDTLDLSRYALMDTLHDYYATKTALAESVHKIDSLAGVTSRDSVRLKNHYYTKDEIDTKLHDTTKYALRTALADTARDIRNSVGNGTLSITYGTNDPVTFKANQNTNSSIAIPAPNDGTLTINYGNHTEGTFSANQSGSTVVNIPQYNGGCDSVTFCQLLQMVIDLTNRVNQLEAANCPTLGAVTVSNVTISSATLTATIGNYDPLTVQEFGFLVSASEIIAYDEAIKYRVTSQTAGVFTMDLIGLQPETTYYVRAYALNDAVRCTQSTMLGAQTPWQTNPSVCPTLTKVVVGTTAVEDSVSLSATMSAFSGEVSDLGFLLTTDPDWTTDVDTVHITPVPSSFTETYTLTQGKAGLAYNVPYYFKAYVKPDSTVCAEDIVFGDTAKFMLKDEDFKITVSSDSVCAGDTVTLTAPEGTAYEWSTNETTRSIKVIQSKKETKAYTVTVTTTSGQKTIGTTVSTLMEPMVIYADSVADHTLEFYLSENITGANYMWNKNGEVISGATTYSYTDNNVNITEAMGSADYYGVTVSLGHCTIKDSVRVNWVANAVRYCGSATVEDHQGNVYNTVFIGHLCWTRENMRTTQYYNGETYVDITNGTQDSVSSSYSAYCYYPANGEPSAVNGYLYNWNAATGNASLAKFNNNVYTRGVCPEGWHLPSFADASYLVNKDYFNYPPKGVGTPPSGYNPGMLAGTGWKQCCENTVASGNYGYEYRNITGFSSVPAGRWDFMEDENLGYNTETTSFWTCLHNGSDPGAFCFFIENDEADASFVQGMIYHKGSGMSVRCVLDSLEGHTYPPTVSAVKITNTGGTLSMSASVLSDGGTNVTARGMCWGISQNPTTCEASGSGVGEFSVVPENLTPGATYYVRAYATNSVTTVYGAEVTFIVPNCPTVTTTVATDVTASTAISGGNVIADGGASVTARGVCWSTSSNPTIADNHTSDGSGTGSFSSSITGLNANTTYYVRAYATNAWGPSYGDQVSFTTPDGKPKVTTSAVSAINVSGTNITATCGGDVTDQGAYEVTARGVCWGRLDPTIDSSHTTDGSGTGVFISNITGLTGGTYYVRAYATNSAGTAYGDIVTLTLPVIDEKSCPEAPTVTDHEGNVYATVKITYAQHGQTKTMCWMRENLRTTTSPKTGTYLVNNEFTGSNNNIITSTYTGKMARWYMNDSATYAPLKYGLLYNWNAALDTFNTSYGETSVNDDQANAVLFNFPSNRRGICPLGWHLPTITEWNGFKSGVGSATNALASGTNTSKFTALFAGSSGRTKFDPSNSRDAGAYTVFFSSQQDGSPGQQHQGRFFELYIQQYTTTMKWETNSYDKHYGFSVRCVKNE